MRDNVVHEDDLEGLLTDACQDPKTNQILTGRIKDISLIPKPKTILSISSVVYKSNLK